MCGIAGIFSKQATDRQVIEAMTLAVKHRGPDAQGIFLDSQGTIALGHARLSVIDLSAGANQPFHSADGRRVLVFNGEIYNFMELRKELETLRGVQFRTHSDTEVIMEAFAAWGPKMVERLEGMFALVIAALDNRTLHVFRDRMGKKPLYYYLSDELFVFASEIKSLLTHAAIRREKTINPTAVSSFLHLGYIPSPHTIYSQIKNFPAGHYGVVGQSFELSTTSFWCVTGKANERIHDSSEACNRLSERIDEAVRARLISDVPLGAFLSGGTDSSLVCAIAAKYVSKPLKTFSIGFSESRFDESGYARAVSSFLKTDHTEYTLSEKDAVARVDTYLRHFDEPFADTSAIPTMLISELARREVKVVLTGDGGDELFHGYGAYTWANRMESLPWKLIRRPVRWVLNASGKNRLERVSRLLKRPTSGGYRSHIFSQEQYYFSQEEIQEKLLSNRSYFTAFEYEDPADLASLSAADRQSLFDLLYYLPDDLLVKVDRASMFHALECRCPLLDHRVVEYAWSLDESLKRREGKTKWIEKQLLRSYLPQALVDRPKWGFSIPLATWLKGELHDLVDEYLSERVTREVGWFNSRYVQHLISEFQAGKEYLYHRLWVLIVFHKWWKENRP